MDVLKMLIKSASQTFFQNNLLEITSQKVHIVKLELKNTAILDFKQCIYSNNNLKYIKNSMSMKEDIILVHRVSILVPFT